MFQAVIDPVTKPKMTLRPIAIKAATRRHRPLERKNRAIDPNKPINNDGRYTNSQELNGTTPASRLSATPKPTYCRTAKTNVTIANATNLEGETAFSASNTSAVDLTGAYGLAFNGVLAFRMESALKVRNNRTTEFGCPFQCSSDSTAYDPPTDSFSRLVTKRTVV